jgi:hypothetical protein
MKQLDNAMAELYAAKKKNASTHNDVASYLKYVRQQERVRTTANSSKMIKAKASGRQTTPRRVSFSLGFLRPSSHLSSQQPLQQISLPGLREQH